MSHFEIDYLKEEKTNGLLLHNGHLTSLELLLYYVGDVFYRVVILAYCVSSYIENHTAVSEGLNRLTLTMISFWLVCFKMKNAHFVLFQILVDRQSCSFYL